MSQPILYIFGGLPASGKSTLARHLARATGSVYLRIDSIEEAILAHGELVGPEGYKAAYNLAGDNLDNGMSVVTDSVNSIEITRSAWREVAISRDLQYREIEIVCSDRAEHQARLEERESQSKIARVLTWKDIENREYEPWINSQVFDTAGETQEESKHRFEKKFILCRNGA
jgi:predicted kinase